MALLMAFTTEGSTRTSQIAINGLKFVVAEVAYGSSGFNPGTPKVALALVPAATTLMTEVYRKSIPPNYTTLDTIELNRGRETTYTSVSGDEFTSVLGEAGIFAVVTDPGTTGLLVGYKFLLAHAHFSRLHFSTYCRLALQWPLDYSPTLPLIAAESGDELETESGLQLES